MPNTNSLPLRPYQQRAKEQIHTEWEQGRLRTLLVLPTGTGKTIVFAAVAEDQVRAGDRVLILAHRGELLEQAADKLQKSTGLGCAVEREGDVVNIDSTGLCRAEIPHSLMRELRSSVIFLGALLARCGEARLSMPGGCELGPRPIDLHLMALRALGAEIEESGGDLVCRAEHLRGASIELPMPSVGATENAMLAACAAEGETVIMNAAREPEIEELQAFLQRLGADVTGAGTPTVTIRGFAPVPRIGHRIMPDR